MVRDKTGSTRSYSAGRITDNGSWYEWTNRGLGFVRKLEKP